MDSINKPVLAISLGTAPAIVPQAILASGIDFGEIQVFTTDHEKLPIILERLSHDIRYAFPGIKLTVTVPDGLVMISSARDFKYFEESLFRWYVSLCRETLPYVCISGGTKTIPTTLLQAARYFGATNIFHTLSDTRREENPDTIDRISELLKKGKVRNMDLGAEPGWPGLKLFYKRDIPDKPEMDKHIPFLFRMRRPEGRFISESIRHVMANLRELPAHSIGESFPFPALLLLPPEKHAWLRQPLDPDTDKEWVRQMPKSDLHCHLGGFATHGEMLEKVRAAAKDALKTNKSVPPLPEGWPLPEITVSLDHYMHLGDASGSQLLTDQGCLAEQVKLIYQQFRNDGLLYAEVRCSPDNYKTAGRDPVRVLDEIISGFNQSMSADQIERGFYCKVNLIIIVTRRRSGDLSSISRHMALAVIASGREKETTGPACEVVGIDLAGFEHVETRASYFTQDFVSAHRCGLAVTAHAGENDDPEGIWQAVYHLHARRLGHALSLLDAPDLMRTVADRRIGIEMCPFANYQVKGFRPMPGMERDYPLMAYLQKGIPVTVNTDNIGISGAGLSDNLLLLARLCPGITRMDLLRLQRNALDVAFISAAERKVLLTMFDRALLSLMISTS